MMKNVVFAAIDASPAAARLAARILPPDVAEVAVADVTGAATPAPLADASVAVALSVFAPRKPSELSEGARPNGVVVVVSPGDDHLAELREPGTREALGVLDVAENKRAAVAEAFEAVGFVAEGETTRVTGRMALNLADLQDVRHGTVGVSRDGRVRGGARDVLRGARCRRGGRRAKGAGDEVLRRAVLPEAPRAMTKPPSRL